MKPVRRPPKKLLLLFTHGLLAWLLVSLACNYPGMQAGSSTLSASELRLTLAAQGTSIWPATYTPEPSSTAAPGAATPLPGETAIPTAIITLPSGATPPALQQEGAFFLYSAQTGDTLAVVAKRFGVEIEEITSPGPLPPQAFLTPGQALNIPNRMGNMAYYDPLLPDGEVVNSPAAADFDIAAYIASAGGFLSIYEEAVDDKIVSGTEIVERVSLETSINPRLLLAVIEHRTGWVFDASSPSQAERDYPIGFKAAGRRGLYEELSMTASHLGVGYYYWRWGLQTSFKYSDGQQYRVSPQLNPGTVALQRLFGGFYKQAEWEQVLYGADGFIRLYQQMFGDPWARASASGPLFPLGLTQPPLELPFTPGERWSLTGGPHLAWNAGSPWGALDFAPVTGEDECVVSRAWVLAPADGIVTRAAYNAVALDLDGDGDERTGWVVVFLHMAGKDMIAQGTRVSMDDPLGHPSCERGRSTGTHIHITRKYNGEWLPAAGPIPMVLSGWEVQGSERLYQGELRKGDQVVVASPVGPRTSIVVR